MTEAQWKQSIALLEKLKGKNSPAAMAAKVELFRMMRGLK